MIRKEKTIPISLECLNVKTQQELLKKVKLQPNLYKEHKCKILNSFSKLNQQHIKKLIHHDQLEFISEMQDNLNIQKLITILVKFFKIT